MSAFSLVFITTDTMVLARLNIVPLWFQTVSVSAALSTVAASYISRIIGRANSNTAVNEIPRAQTSWS